jgi:hypothetical protein
LELGKEFLTAESAESAESNMNHTSFFSSSMPSAPLRFIKKNLIHKQFIKYQNETDIFSGSSSQWHNNSSKFVSRSS